MKRNLVFVTTILWASALVAADSNPKEALLSASKNLAGKANYSWKTTVEVPGDPTGTIEGKAEKDGAMVLALARGDQAFDGVLKGDKGAVKSDEGWKSLTEATAQDSGQSGAVRFVARLLQSFKAPPAEVPDLVEKTKDLKLAEGVYAGTLTEAAVKELLMFRVRMGGNDPEVSGAKGSVKFWLKDGALSKYELKLQGTISYNGNDREVNRTHLTEIKDIGTTKVVVPEEAAKKL